MIDFNATIIAQVLNFLFLVFILAKFAYKPVINMMEDRKNKIASDLGKTLNWRKPKLKN